MLVFVDSIVLLYSDVLVNLPPLLYYRVMRRCMYFYYTTIECYLLVCVL